MQFVFCSLLIITPFAHMVSWPLVLNLLFFLTLSQPILLLCLPILQLFPYTQQTSHSYFICLFPFFRTIFLHRTLTWNDWLHFKMLATHKNPLLGDILVMICCKQPLKQFNMWHFRAELKDKSPEFKDWAGAELLLPQLMCFFPQAMQDGSNFPKRRKSTLHWQEMQRERRRQGKFAVWCP